MLGPSEDKPRRSLIAGTIKTVVIVGGLSWLAAGLLSSATHDNQTLSRLAGNIARGQADPLTTGSLADRAGGARLDPCTGARR